jgi:S-adenosylmethionine:tRNA-ribosyltransferase-isomerase (queuine synthetase)
MLVSAFRMETMRGVSAVKNGYRFYYYDNASLLFGDG